VYISRNDDDAGGGANFTSCDIMAYIHFIIITPMAAHIKYT